MPKRSRKVTVTGKDILRGKNPDAPKINENGNIHEPGWVNPAKLPITEQQDMFCRLYVKLRYKGKAAAIAAGYAENSAAVQASALLNKPNIEARVNHYKEAMCERFDYSVQRIIQEYCRLAFINMDDLMRIQEEDGTAYVDFSKLTRDQAAAIAEITTEEVLEKDQEMSTREESVFKTIRKVRFKLHDKKGALEDLAKIQKLFVNQNQFLGADGKPVAPPALNISFVTPGKK